MSQQLILASVLLFWLIPASWWLPALAAIVVSQSVIIASWDDAKFGAIANLIVFIPTLVAAFTILRVIWLGNTHRLME